MSVLNNIDGEIKEITVVDSELKETVAAFYQDYTELTSNKEKYGDRQLLSVVFKITPHGTGDDICDIDAIFKMGSAIHENNSGSELTLMSEIRWNSKASTVLKLYNVVNADTDINVPMALSVTL